MNVIVKQNILVQSTSDFKCQTVCLGILLKHRCGRSRGGGFTFPKGRFEEGLEETPFCASSLWALLLAQGKSKVIPRPCLPRYLRCESGTVTDEILYWVSVSRTVSEFYFHFLWSNVTSLNDPKIKLVSFVKNGSSYKN